MNDDLAPAGEGASDTNGAGAASRGMVPSAAEMERGVHHAANLLRSLAHPQRLGILCLLIEGEKTVSELMRRLDMRQSTVSQQLQRLRSEHLVQSRRAGKHVYYSLADPAPRAIIETLHGIYCLAPRRQHGV